MRISLIEILMQNLILRCYFSISTSILFFNSHYCIQEYQRMTVSPCFGVQPPVDPTLSSLSSLSSSSSSTSGITTADGQSGRDKAVSGTSAAPHNEDSSVQAPDPVPVSNGLRLRDYQLEGDLALRHINRRGRKREIDR